MSKSTTYISITYINRGQGQLILAINYKTKLKI
jgi:hypothetical protein